MIRIVALIVLAGLLAGCAANHALVAPPDAPRLDSADSTSLKACAAPVKVPAGAKSQSQVEALWGVDTDHLIECGERHRILVNFVRNRDGGLTGAVATKK